MTDTGQLRGRSLIVGDWVEGDNGSVTAVNPSTEESLSPEYSLVGSSQLEEATTAAEEAFPTYSALEPTKRANFLDSIADGIESRRDAIVERAQLETGLPDARLNGEVSRTANQLRMFADVVRTGYQHQASITPALPDRTPAPRPDLRQRAVPLGPVGVFGASNFPLAFSTAGGDTASALAAGCPVVFKAHNAHPGTSELVAAAIHAAIMEHELHPGVYSLIYGPGAEIGQQLAADPRIAAIGFTGSRRAGLSITNTAQARPVPIPVYAEMSSINPVFVLPGATATEDAARTLADDYVGSVTGSSGQLCTQPGLLFLPRTAGADAFLDRATELISAATGQTMLTPGIAAAWNDGVDALSRRPGVDVVAKGTDGDGLNAPGPVLFASDVATLTSDEVLQAEIFGATSLVIRYDDVSELSTVAGLLEGQLTATFQADETDVEDTDAVRRLLPQLERLAGRILFGGWPTGVEVGHVMVHGGPFPATSDSRTTSVGSRAIERFLRTVAYQGFPEDLRPAPVTETNPFNAPRLVEGHYTEENL